MPLSLSAASGHVIGHSPLRVWGLPSALRLRRQLARAGAADASAERAVLLRADWVYDQAVVRGLVTASDDSALLSDDGECTALNVSVARLSEAAAALAGGRAPPAVRTLAVTEIASGYDDALRKRGPPYLMRLRPDTLAAVERRVFGGAYKGVTDAVTLYAWPAPARAVTRWCARWNITPNQVTFASLLLVLGAMWLFWTGHYGPGLLAAWTMTFLDTVDGKLARVTLQSSRFGELFDHSIDLIHPPFWWWAWIVGLPAAGFPLAQPSAVLGAIVAGYALQRIEEGLFIACFGMEIHVWQRFDSRFRLITARRNPNLLLLTASAVAGRPDLGILTVAAWTVISFLIHAVRLAQAALQRRHGTLRSWLAP